MNYHKIIDQKEQNTKIKGNTKEEDEQKWLIK